MDKYYTLQEISDMLKIRVEVLRGYANNKALKAAKIGKSWRVKEQDLNDFLEKRTNINDDDMEGDE